MLFIEENQTIQRSPVHKSNRKCMANPPFNLFDVLLAIVLVGGLIQGRKNGLSVELLRVLKWFSLVLVCAGLYAPAGNLIVQFGFFDLLSCYVISYLGIALL